MQTKRQSKISLDVEMTKNFGFSVSFCPKELLYNSELLQNPNKNAGKFVGIWYNNKRVNTAVAGAKWLVEYITGDSEEEVYNKYHEKFETKYKSLIENQMREEKQNKKQSLSSGSDILYSI